MNPSVLDRIVAQTRERVAQQKIRVPLARLLEKPQTRSLQRPFAEALVRSDGPGVIAEYKRRSPTCGVIREDLDVVHMAYTYENAGAAAMSVLTQEQDFGGSLFDLQQARQVSRLPVLRKDFIIDPYQVWESWRAEADAVLLIAAALDAAELRELMRVAEETRVEVLVEVHDERELALALDAGARLVGANSRNLKTLDVDLGIALRLGAGIPDDVVAVAESGIRSRTDVLRLRDAGYDALLVGEHLMRATDPGRALAELLGKAEAQKR